MPPIKPRPRASAPPAPKMKLGAWRPAPPPRRAPEPASRRLTIAIFVGGGFLLAAAWLGGSMHAAMSAFGRGFDQLAIGSGFGAIEIALPADLTPAQARETRAALAFEEGEPLYRADPGQLRARLRRLPFVEDAAVYRFWPNRLVVAMRVRQAYALAPGPEGASGLWVIDRDGQPIRPALAADIGRLPAIRGPGGAAAAHELAGFFRSNGALRRALAHADYINGRHWRLVLKDGVFVELPETSPLAPIAAFEALNTRTPVLGAGKFTRFDLRTDGRLYLLLRRDQAAPA